MDKSNQRVSCNRFEEGVEVNSEDSQMTVQRDGMRW